MSENTSSDELERLIEAYVRYLEGTDERPNLAGNDPAVVAEASELFRLLDTTWAGDLGLPPLEEDPVAIALGLVDVPVKHETVTIIGAKVAAVRRRSGLRPSDVAKRLSESGHASRAKTIVGMEGASATEVSAMFLVALADALGCSSAELLAATDTEFDEFASWIYSDDFRLEVANWAAETDYQGTDPVSQARNLMLTTSQRSGGNFTRGDWITILRSVLECLQ